MMVTLLVMLLMSCVSTRTEYIERLYVPSINFPIFPELELDEKGITVSEDWILRLAEYKIRIEETEKNYNEMKELYDEHKR